MMTYRDLLSAINRDLCDRSESRLDLPVVLAVIDDRGVVHAGQLVAFSVGEIPGGSPPSPSEEILGAADLLVVPRAASASASAISASTDSEADRDTEVVDPEDTSVSRDAIAAAAAADFDVGDTTRIIHLRNLPAGPVGPASVASAALAAARVDDDDTPTQRRDPAPCGAGRHPRSTLVRSSPFDPRPSRLWSATGGSGR